MTTAIIQIFQEEKSYEDPKIAPNDEENFLTVNGFLHLIT